MPKIRVKWDELERLVGKPVDEDVLMNIKCEVDGEEDGYTVIEVADTNRPDLWSVEGLARELRGVLGVETGPPTYKTGGKYGEVLVSETVLPIRPYIAVAAVTGVTLGESGYEQLIQLQEKVMQTYGRNRKKVAIGTSRLDMISFPVRYTAVKGEHSFVPLYGDREMTVEEILSETEKGREYGWILEGFDVYPMLIDDEGRTISFPPIINSNDVGRIDADTENIFVDVTGTDWRAVTVALNVIVSALAERGGTIHFVDVVYPDRTVRCPDLSGTEISLDAAYVRKITGLDLDVNDISSLLSRMRHDVSTEGERITVRVPFYRGDVFHQRDLVEDVLIAIGYNNVPLRDIPYPTPGGPSDDETVKNLLRELAIGAGHQEVLTFILTSPGVLEKAGVTEYIELDNPVSATFSVLRPSLLPSLLDFLAHNTGEEYPQKVFEVGEVVLPSTETRIRFAVLEASSTVTFTDARRTLDFILRALGLDPVYEPSDVPPFLPGRTARVTVEGKVIGYVGEVHPQVLEKFGVHMPVAGFELDVFTLKSLLH